MSEPPREPEMQATQGSQGTLGLPADPEPHASAPTRHGPAGYAVLAWLLVTSGRFAWAAGTGFGDDGIPWWSMIATGAVALLAAAAVLPFMRFRRSGWEMAMWVLVTALVMDVARIVLGTRQWLPVALAAGASAFCLGYMWRARHAFLDHDDWEHADDDAHHPPLPATAAAEAPVRTDPVADALGAIHRKIVDAGSACAVPREVLLAEAARFGVRPEALRREGLSLYRTFLGHFRADGALTVEKERELFCLEGALELDAIAVARLRSEVGAADRAHRDEPIRPAPRAVPVVETAQVMDDTDHPLDARPAEAAPVDDGRPSIDPAPVQRRAREEKVFMPGPADGVATPRLRGDETPAETSEPAETPFMTDAPVLAGTTASSSGLEDYEQHELEALTGWAGIVLPPHADGRASLEALRTFHRIATEPLETVEAGQALDDGERAFAERTVELYRMPAGAAADPAPSEGAGLDPLAFVDGSLGRDRDLSRYQRAGFCRFLVTDRRLLLVARSGQKSPLPLERIRSVHPHRNGVEVRPQRGGPVFLAFGDGVADVAMRIGRALRERAGAPRA
jgi:hypothetical protein